MEFPRTVYVKGPGMEVNGGTLTPLLVCNEEEHTNALASGYFPSVPEALAEKLDEPLVEKLEEPLTETETETEEAETEKADSRSSYEILLSLPDEQLFEEAKERGVSVEGSRKELIDRIYLAAGYSAEGIPTEPTPAPVLKLKVARAKKE